MEQEKDFLKMYLIPSKFIASKVSIQCTYFKIAKFSYHLSLDVGEIQFIKMEFIVAPNSYEIEVTVERIHIVKEKVEVNWKLISENHNFHIMNGTVFFDYEDIQKVIKLDMVNITLNHSLKMVLFEPSNGYHLGEKKVANISFVGKFLLKLIPIKKEV